MAYFEELNDEAVESVSGGIRINTKNPEVAHWQATNVSMGATFTHDGALWYRIKPGDTLDSVAAKFATDVNTLRANNPSTLQGTDRVYVGDAILIHKG